MGAVVVEIVAEMESGETHAVVADQRDVARWEIQDFGCPFSELSERPHLGMRWLAWSALTRRGVISMSWETFDAQCVEAGAPGDDQGDGQGEVSAALADAVDPGRPGRSGGRSSGSRRRPDSR